MCVEIECVLFLFQVSGPHGRDGRAKVLHDGDFARRAAARRRRDRLGHRALGQRRRGHRSQGEHHQHTKELAARSHIQNATREIARGLQGKHASFK